MATAQTHPRTHSETTNSSQVGHGSTGTGHSDGHHPVRTALRGAGVFLDTTWRVLLLGGEGIDGARR
jgi:hypothetical protein